jgi:hypothetical protein
MMGTPLQPVCYLLRSIASPYPLKRSTISLSLRGSIGLHPWQNNFIINVTLFLTEKEVIQERARAIKNLLTAVAEMFMDKCEMVVLNLYILY